MIWLNFFFHKLFDRLQERHITSITIELVTLKLNSTAPIVDIHNTLNTK